MKHQPKLELSQLNLPLLDPVPLALPIAKDQQLVQALVELLLNAVVKEGGDKHDQADR